AAEWLRDQGVEAIAIAFLNSFVNPEHELRAKEIVLGIIPSVFVCASSEILPEIRELERTSTTVASVYLGPTLSTYLNELSCELRAPDEDGGARLFGGLLISHSGGGVMTVSSARELRARSACP